MDVEVGLVGTTVSDGGVGTRDDGGRVEFFLAIAEGKIGWAGEDSPVADVRVEDMKETLVSDGVSENIIDVIYNWSYQDEPYDIADNTTVSGMFKKDF